MSRGFRSVMAIAITATLFSPAFTSAGSAATGKVIDEGWVSTRTTQSGGHQAVRFRDVPEFYERISTLLARVPYWKSCTSTTTAPCDTAPRIEFSAVMQPCASATQLDCVVEFGTIDTNGTRSPAAYAGAFPRTAVNGYAAEPSIGLPPGGPGGLWSVAPTSGSTTQLHYLGAMVYGTTTPGKNVTFNGFYATVSPVEIKNFDCSGPAGVAANCAPSYVKDGQNPSDPDKVGYVDNFGRESGLYCVMSGNLDNATGMAECALRKAFSKDVRYYLTVRISQAISGWMHGRMAEPDITIENVAGSTEAITMSIAARAVSVPAVDLERKFVELPQALQDKYRATGDWNGTGASGYGDAAFETDPLLRNRESRPTSFGNNSIAELEAWIPVVNDTAVADLSTWSVRTLGSRELGAAEGCVTDKNKVAGIVTTNATVYKAAAPAYDSTTQSLNYTVSAPHYMSSGEPFKGAYSLIIRSDVARCIYKFTSAPVTSSIEVIDTGAEANTVVTNVSEGDGWIRLTASGFTHSTPTIRAKLTQAGSTAPTTGAPTSARPVATATKRLPKVAVGRAASTSSILKWAKMRATKTSRVSLSVTKSPAGVCFVNRTSVVGSKKGTCVVSIVVVTGSKRSSGTVQFRVG